MSPSRGGEEKALAVALPLFGTHARVMDALERANKYGAKAVVSSDGEGFWLHTVVDLDAAAKDTPARTLRDFQHLQLPVLSTQVAYNIGLDLTRLDAAKVQDAFPSASDDAIITSVLNNSAGERLVMALVKSGGMFQVVDKVWRCPEDNQAFSSPGICPKHGLVLVPG